MEVIGIELLIALISIALIARGVNCAIHVLHLVVAPNASLQVFQQFFIESVIQEVVVVLVVQFGENPVVADSI